MKIQFLSAVILTFFSTAFAGRFFPSMVTPFQPVDAVVVERRSGEDRIFTDKIRQRNAEIFVYAVFDGHGGKAVAEYAKKNFASALSLHLPQYSANAEISPHGIELTKEAIENTFLAFDKTICSKDGNKEQGATATVLLRIKNMLFTANLGDSNAAISLKDETLKLDIHKPNQPGERERVQAAGGFILWNRVGSWLAVSRALGDCAFKIRTKVLSYEDVDSNDAEDDRGTSDDHVKEEAEPEYNADGWVSARPAIMNHELPQGKTKLILASDGLWDVVTPKEAVDLIKDGGDKPAELLKDHAIEKGSGDDIAVIVDEIKRE